MNDQTTITIEPETKATTAPSGWKIEQAMSAWQSARSRLLVDDSDLAHDEAALSALLGPEEGDVRDILSRLLRAAQHATAMADAAAEMLANLKARQDRYKRRNEVFRGTIFAILDAVGERKMEFAHGTMSLGKGKEVAIITDEDALEDRFVKVVTSRTPDKAAILTALKDGEVVDGAALSNSLPTLTIRSK